MPRLDELTHIPKASRNSSESSTIFGVVEYLHSLVARLGADEYLGSEFALRREK
jgi:hypothetical protein